MFGEYELRDIALTANSQRRKVEALLRNNGLRLDPLDVFVGIYDSDDELVGGGGLKGNVIKCVVIDAALRSELLANTLITRLREIAFSRGHENIFVFTKPENEPVFCSLAFHVVGRSPRAILMESNPRGIQEYARRLHALQREGRNGVVVMNCNPLTLGHLHLIRHSAGRVDNLYVILVNEDCSCFSYRERYGMVAEAVKPMPNVTLVEGGPYTISSATFPSYFIKEAGDAAEAQIDLDLDIFRRHIAPALNASVRFVGSEPADKLTRRYNERMKQTLDIEVEEIPRLEMCGKVVSASLVRRLTAENNASEALPIVPAPTVAYIISHAATTALRTELALTPKPGLVDRHDNGAHRDMDFALMERSIQALQPFFTELALLGRSAAFPSAKDVRAIGLRAEKAMLQATGGVNTHRGALFSMGLAVVAASACLHHSGTLGPEELRTAIARLAAGFAPAQGTHGSEVRERYKISGAVETAQGGYAQLFSSWLPSYQSGKRDDEGKMKLLLLIMSQIDDTNIYFRGGKEAAIEVKHLSLQMLSRFSPKEMESMNERLVSKNISPGGAADMLALTFFVDSICDKNNPKIYH